MLKVNPSQKAKRVHHNSSSRFSPPPVLQVPMGFHETMGKQHLISTKSGRAANPSVFSY
jgi:hypothetical protein